MAMVVNRRKTGAPWQGNAPALQGQYTKEVALSTVLPISCIDMLSPSVGTLRSPELSIRTSCGRTLAMPGQGPRTSVLIAVPS